MKIIVCALLFVFIFVVFCGADLGDDWDSFASQDNGSRVTGEQDGARVDVEVGDLVSDDLPLNFGGFRYTENFYFALGVVIVGVFIVLLFAYLFFRRPRNKWERLD